MAERMTGKVAVVTGGAKGIGRGCAEMLAREGAAVVIGDIDRDVGAQTSAGIRASGHEAAFYPTDVLREEQCASLMSRAAHAYGRVDVLINNVGWFPRGTLEETTSELWDAVLAINLRSHFFCTKHAVPHLRRSGGGSIINIGSTAGIQATPNLLAYSAAKGGLISMTRTLAGALAPDRIRVNYVVPGWILTEAEIALQHRRGLDDEMLMRAGSALPLGRHQTIEDVAYAVLFLASDESSQVTGTVLNVDAGVSVLPIGAQSVYVG
ncbi:MAG TPA: SDR family NAD(P)-dependent oxidoreductase [Chloroflexota bacterium]